MFMVRAGMFADVALARRIEMAEAEMMRDYFRGVHSAGAFTFDVAGGVAKFARPGSPINKIIGAGIDAPLDSVTLEEIEDRYRSHGEASRIELTTLAAPDRMPIFTSLQVALLRAGRYGRRSRCLSTRRH